MPLRRYLNPKPPSAADLEQEQRDVERLNEEFHALFPAGSNPWQWPLPSGNNIEQASGIELLNTGRLLMALGSRKQNQTVVDVQRSGDGIYQVKLNGQTIGNVYRYLGQPPRIKGGSWYAVDINGRAHYWLGDSGFAARDDAVEALVASFA